MVFISELAERSHSLSAVRITGRVTFLDPVQRYCQVEDQQCLLMVDLSLVDMTRIRVQHLIQIFGTIQSHPSGGKVFPNCTDSFFLSAKVIRDVDSLDLNLYRESVLYRRNFLETC